MYPYRDIYYLFLPQPVHLDHLALVSQFGCIAILQHPPLWGGGGVEHIYPPPQRCAMSSWVGENVDGRRLVSCCSGGPGFRV